MIKTITPTHWKDYELIDSGNFSKLERFGNQILNRPEPQAVWDRSLPDDDWHRQAAATFTKEKNESEKGRWIINKGTREQWFISYAYKEMNLRMRLGLTGFRHIGVFPEQGDNWNFIYDRLTAYNSKRNTAYNLPGGTAPDSQREPRSDSQREVRSGLQRELGSGLQREVRSGLQRGNNDSNAKPRVLNLFAYTGGASLAAAAAGADVFHVDSVKPVITWARENAEANNLTGIHWVVEDALKFVKREVRRGSKYQAIILDPPAYGRGAEGEKWVLEENINEMIRLCAQLLSDDPAFFILSLYSMGLSALIGENLIRSSFGNIPTLEPGELYLEDKFQKKLPLGTVVRF